MTTTAVPLRATTKNDAVVDEHTAVDSALEHEQQQQKHSATNVVAAALNNNAAINAIQQNTMMTTTTTTMAMGSEIRLAIYNFEKRLGVYHVGVLVHGKEFHFGVKRGIVVCPPRNEGKTFHVIAWNFLPRKLHFLRYVDLASADGTTPNTQMHTRLTLDQLLVLKGHLERGRFGPHAYRFYWNNCVDFCFTFLRLIAVNGMDLRKQALPRVLRQPWLTEPVRAVGRQIGRRNKRQQE